jgi:hypothetical protein
VFGERAARAHCTQVRRAGAGEGDGECTAVQWRAGSGSALHASAVSGSGSGERKRTAGEPSSSGTGTHSQRQLAAGALPAGPSCGKTDMGPPPPPTASPSTKDAMDQSVRARQMAITKFRSMSLPRGVCATSGWNCTPYMGAVAPGMTPAQAANSVLSVAPMDTNPAGREVILSPWLIHTCRGRTGGHRGRGATPCLGGAAPPPAGPPPPPPPRIPTPYSR